MGYGFPFLSRADYNRMDFGSLDINSSPGRDGCISGRGEGALFLHRYSAEDMMGFLRRTGFVTRLEGIGYRDLLFVVDCDPDMSSVFRIYSGSRMAGNLLVDLRVSERRFIPSSGRASSAIYDMVHIEWFNSRDPRRAFSSSRKRLPAQDAPGLGALPSFMDVMDAIGRDLGRDGFLAMPDHLYGAMMYGRRFHFYDPAIEGTLQALRRDLRHVSLADIAWGSLAGAIRDRSTGCVFNYEPAPQIAPCSGRMTGYFRSGGYMKSALRAFHAAGFVLDRDILESRRREIKEGE